MHKEKHKDTHRHLHNLSGERAEQIGIVFRHALLFAAKLLDALAGVQHCRVIAATKRITDLRKTVTRQFFRERHRNLAGTRD